MSVATQGQVVEVAPGDERVVTWDVGQSAGTGRYNLIANDSVHDAMRGTFTGGSGVFRVTIPRAPRGDIDFNNDRLYPDTQDLLDFLAVYAGGACPLLRCDTIDFNRDDLSPDTGDVESILRVFAGGGCV